MSARVMYRRSSSIRLNASDCVRPSAPDVSLMSRQNYTSIRKCVFPNTVLGSAILLELLGRKLLQYFHVSKGYNLTFIQESYTVCGYKFINNFLPSIPTNLFFFFRWCYSPLWALACPKIPLHFPLSFTNSLHLLTPST